MVAAKLATLQDGVRKVGKFADVPSQPEAAALVNVGERERRRKLSEAAKEREIPRRDNGQLEPRPGHVSVSRPEVPESARPERNKTRERMHAIEKHSPELVP